MINRKCSLTVSAIIVFCISCQKKIDSFTSPPLSDYAAFVVGKYITYDLDSTVFKNFGTQTIIKYQAKDSIAEELVDNIGRKAYKIMRFLRKNSSENWIPDNTFFAVPSTNNIEVIQNNLRFIKLVLPVNDKFSWKGNRYLPTVVDPNYQFSSSFMEDWDYTYGNINMPLQIGSLFFDSTITVAHIDEISGIPGDTTYADRTYSSEKYAKHTGLIYREFIHWEYQPRGGGYSGYGEKMTIIDHN